MGCTLVGHRWHRRWMPYPKLHTNNNPLVKLNIFAFRDWLLSSNVVWILLCARQLCAKHCAVPTLDFDMPNSGDLTASERGLDSSMQCGSRTPTKGRQQALKRDLRHSSLLSQGYSVTPADLRRHHHYNHNHPSNWKLTMVLCNCSLLMSWTRGVHWSLVSAFVGKQPRPTHQATKLPMVSIVAKDRLLLWSSS